MFLRAIVLCAVVQAGADGPGHDVVQLPRRGPAGFVGQEGREYLIVPGVPLPLSATEVECWSWLLQLSEAQQLAMNDLLRQYVDDEEEVHRKFVQPFWDHTADFGGGHAVAGDIRIAMAFTEFIERDLPQVVRRIVQVEDRVFERLPEILAESQLPRLELVRQFRERTRCKLPDARYPGSDVDLVYLLDELRRDGLDLTLIGDEGENLDEILAQYSAEVTPLCKARREAAIEVAKKGTVALATAMNATPGAREQARQQRRNVHRRLVELEKRIHATNVRYIGLLAQALPEATAGALQQGWREYVFPTIYPDPSNPDQILTKAIEVLGPDDPRSAELDDIRTQVMARHRELCSAMEREWLEWRERFGVEWSYQLAGIDAFEEKMLQLNEQRRANGRVGITYALAVLGDEAKQLDNAVIAYEARLKDHHFVIEPRMGR